MHNPFLRQDDHSSSFLPQDYIQRKAELRANIICLSLFGVVMFGIVGAFFVTNRQWLQVRRERQAITVQYTQQAARIEQLKNLESQKAEMMAKAEVTTALIEKVPRSILMAEIVTRMPEDLALLELHLASKRVREGPAPRQAQQATARAANDRNAQIRTLGGRAGAQRPGAAAAAPERIAPPRFEYTLKIIGVARANNNIADFLAALKACSLLDDVELKYIKTSTIDRVEFRHFEIEATLRRDADGRGIDPTPEIRQAMETVATGKEEAKPGQSGPGQTGRSSTRPVTAAVPEGGK
jgi:Tfp pilus assembly protein PilN